MPFNEILNKYRVFPRLFSILYGYLVWQTSQWFMSLETPTIEQSGFVTAMAATAAAFFKFYVDSGPKKPTDE